MGSRLMLQHAYAHAHAQCCYTLLRGMDRLGVRDRTLAGDARQGLYGCLNHFGVHGHSLDQHLRYQHLPTAQSMGAGLLLDR